MIQAFRNTGTEDIFNGKNSSLARKTCPQSLWNVVFRKLDQLDSAVSLSDLQAPPGNCLEALKGGRSGQFRIRINDRYRICFLWTDQGPDKVEIVDHH